MEERQAEVSETTAAAAALALVLVLVLVVVAVSSWMGNWILVRLPAMAAASAVRRMCWVSAQRETGSAGDSADGFAGSCGRHGYCGHATNPVDWPPDGPPGLGLDPGSCDSCCRLVLAASGLCRLGCVVMVCRLRLMIARFAFASGA